MSDNAPSVLKDDDTFRDFLIERLRINYYRDEDVKSNFPHSKAAVFTHGDIKPKNIMVSADGHITSLLDWEYSGFMPDYWEAAGMLMIVWGWEKECPGGQKQWSEQNPKTGTSIWLGSRRLKRLYVLAFGRFFQVLLCSCADKALVTSEITSQTSWSSTVFHELELNASRALGNGHNPHCY